MLEGCVPWPAELAALYRREGYWQGRPLGDLLDEACARHADKTALVCGERRMTYARLSAESSALAGGLLNRGIEPLDRVVVQLPNMPEFVVVVFALLRIGAQQCLGANLAPFAPRLLQREHVGGSDLVLPLASVLVGVALIVGLAARHPHLEQEATLGQVEIIDLFPTGDALRGSHKARRQRNTRHCGPVTNYVYVVNID